MEGEFHKNLKINMHEFVVFVYQITKNLPKSELYGTTSQIRRAALSIILNYVEGYARKRDRVKLNFYEISYGSTQESKYLIFFCHTQHWMNKDEYQKALNLVNKIGAMLWGTIEDIENRLASAA